MDENVISIQIEETEENTAETSHIDPLVESYEVEAEVPEFDATSSNQMTMDEITVGNIESDVVETVEIDIEEAVGWAGGDNTIHDNLAGRDAPDQHPITSIIGLRTELDQIEALQTIYSDKKQQADYYLWHDENPLQENRDGLFVSFEQNTNNLHLCYGDTDVFGVTVAEAGFVGGQEYVQAVDGTKVGRDRKYGLVVHSGLVGVRRETTVAVGDYVVPNSRGEAQKSEGNYGYLVTALSEVNGLQYAIISLSAPSTLAQNIADSVEDLNDRMSTAEYNITSVTNVANSAYVMAQDAKESMDANIELIGGQVSDALDRVEAVEGTVGNLSESVNNANATAALAKTTAEGAVSSAEAMKDEAVAKANEALAETTNTRKDLETKIDEINTELDNTNLELQATKESIESTRDQLQSDIDSVSSELEDTKTNLNSTRDELSADIDKVASDLNDTKDELNTTRNQLQSNIDATSSELNKTKEELNTTKSNVEALEDDLVPLSTWPDAENPTGIAGFVARADEDSATLGELVKWQGETNTAIAGVTQTANDNKASIDTITLWQGETDESLAAVSQKADENSTSIQSLTSWKDTASQSITSLEQKSNANESSIKALTAWQDEAKTSIAKVEQKASDNESAINSLTEWKDDTNTSIANIEQRVSSNESGIQSLTTWQGTATTAIANVEQKASDNETAITGLTSWKETASESIAKVEQKADANESNIKSLTEWKDEAAQSIADVEVKSNANESNITLLTEWKSSVEDDVESIASIKTQSDANKSAIEGLTSWKGEASASLTSVQQQSDANKASIDAITLWQGDTDESITEVKQQANANKASIESLTEWKGTTSESIASIEQRVDGTESSITELTSWQGDAETAITNVEQKASDNETKINSLTTWQGETNTAIANVEQKATNNESAITNLTSWKDEASESIATVEQTANKNSADISSIASWKSDVESDVSSIASIKTTADDNKAAIEQLVKKDTELSTTIAGVKTTADANKASIEEITSWQSNVDPTINSVAGIKQTADANAAEIESLTSWQGTTNTSMANLQQQVDDNGAKIEALVANIDKYSVGEYSQAYGLTLEQAKEILAVDTVYVPTIVHSETYDAYTQEFSLGYYYTWDGEKWVPSDSTAVSFSSEYIQGTTTTPYWVVTIADVVNDETTYDLGGLYKWENSAWVKVASMADNTLSRAVSAIKQTTNSISAEISNVKGDVSGLTARVDANETSLQTVTSWKSAVEEDVSKIATIEQKTNDNTSSIALVVSEKDGEKVVNSASIVTAINNGESSVTIDADHINFEAENYTIHADNINFEGSQFSSTMSETYSTKDETETAKQDAIAAAADDVDEKLKDYSTTTEMDSAINQKADSITLSVSQTYSTKDAVSGLEERIEAAESSIEVNKDNIKLKVEKDGVISSINQTSETVTISANRLDLSGVLTISAKADLVSSVEILYARSNSAATFTATTDWSTIAPEWVEGEYMWQKTITTYANEHTEESDPVCIQGAKGESGTGFKKINTSVRSQPMATWRDDYVKRSSIKWDETAQDNSHISVGDIAYLIGTVTDIFGADGNPLGVTFYGSVTAVDNTGVTMTPSHYVMDGSKGQDGNTPTVGTNGNWWINGQDTGIKAEGVDGNTPTIEINANGYWVVNGETTTVKATGDKGDPGIYIATITEQYYLSTSVADTVDGTWEDITDNATLPIEKGKYRFRRQKHEWSDGTTTHTTARLDETDQRILKWCHADDTALIDGGSIYAKTIIANHINIKDVSDIDGVTGGGWTISPDAIHNDKVGMYSGSEVSYVSLVNEGTLSPVRFYAGAWDETVEPIKTATLTFTSDEVTKGTTIIKEIEAETNRTVVRCECLTPNKIHSGTVQKSVILTTGNQQISGVGVDAKYYVESDISEVFPSWVLETHIKSLICDNENISLVYKGDGVVSVTATSNEQNQRVMGSITGEYEFDEAITVNFEVGNVLSDTTKEGVLVKFTPQTSSVEYTLDIRYVVDVKNQKFKVLEDGSLYASAAQITGTINATDGEFNGTIKASQGEIAGMEIIENGLINDYFSLTRDDSANLTELYLGNKTTGKIVNIKNDGTINADSLQLNGDFVCGDVVAESICASNEEDSNRIELVTKGEETNIYVSISSQGILGTTSTTRRYYCELTFTPSLKKRLCLKLNRSWEAGVVGTLYDVIVPMGTSLWRFETNYERYMGDTWSFSIDDGINYVTECTLTQSVGDGLNLITKTGDTADILINGVPITEIIQSIVDNIITERVKEDSLN